MKAEYLFVYGTLMSSFENEYRHFLSDNAVRLGKAFLKGKLYDLGEYPGFKAVTDGALVWGELYSTRDLPESFFHFLDEYEGDEYKRVCLEAVSEGSSVYTWVYEYIGTCDEQSLISGGDYLEYLQNNK